MNLRVLRERKLLSQERLAEMSGLSLRTIQRIEAGHRVSYASLRALATALQTDADALERELYAVNNSTGEFVEIPRWVRLLDGRRWFGGRGLSRRDFLVVEVFCLICSCIAFATLFGVASEPAAFGRAAGRPAPGGLLSSRPSRSASTTSTNSGRAPRMLRQRSLAHGERSRRSTRICSGWGSRARCLSVGWWRDE